MPDPSQTLLVTGGRGRLAALIADHFGAPRHRVHLFSREAGPGFRALGELLDPGVLASADVIFHLAWSTLPATSALRPSQGEADDLQLLGRLLDALAKVPAAHRPLLVFFSTGGAVYGNAPGRPNREDDPCHPIGSYGRAKLEAEQLLLARARCDALPCAVLRISNPYGYPVPRRRAQGIVPHALRCATEAQTLELWGDGTARKDFLYYTDFLAGLTEVVARRLTGVFNLAAGQSHTVNDVLAEVERATGRPLALTRLPAPAWDVQDSRLDNMRFVAATGWRPQVSLAEGIRRAAAGYRSD